MDKVISRRDFIVGGGVFGASMAASAPRDALKCWPAVD
ncbi:MAG: twin-arginine translocation signal domain-containing protein [Eggerthellaceae bacterium]